MRTCVFAAVVVASPAAAQSLTIAQAVDEAVQHNLSLLAERANLSIADAQMITARLRPNPVFSFSADHLDWLGTGFDATNNGGPPEIAWRVDVPLERGGKRDARIGLASVVKSAAEAQLADAIRTLRQDATLACVDVIAAQATRALVSDNLRTFEDLARVNRARVTAGSIAPFESTRSDVAMLQFRATVVRADLDLAAATARLRVLLGRAPGDPVTIADTLASASVERPPDLTRLQDLARQSRPDLHALRFAEARTIADLRLQEALGRIDYTVGAEYRRQQGIAGRGNSVGVFFSAPLPVANRNQGEIARAGAERAQVDRQIAAREAQIASDRPDRVPRVRHDARSRDQHRDGPAAAGDESPRHLRVHVSRRRRHAPRAARRAARLQRHDAELRRRAGEPASRRHAAERRCRHGGGPMTRRADVLIALIASIAIASAGCGDHSSAASSGDAESSAPRPTPGAVTVDQNMLASIKVEPIVEQETTNVLAVAGKVQFDEERVARVLVPLGGQVINLHVKIGDPIRKGETLCAINSREAAAAVGDFIEARKDVELAEKTAGMTEDLFQHEAASRIALQQAQSDLAKARSRAARTEEALRVLGLSPSDDLSRFNGRVPILAPIAGVVIDRKVTDGQFVQTDSTPIITIADLSAVWVIGDVFERDLHLASVGQTATITTSAYPGEKFSGRVNYISDAIDPATRTAKVRVSVANPRNRLKPEMFAAVSLDVAARERAILVPADAVFTEGGRTFVYEETGRGRFVRRPVEIAQGDGSERRVVSGLHPGDRIVVDGALLLRQQEQKQPS
jgi:RND family efflux transporter MFP subunit